MKINNLIVLIPCYNEEKTINKVINDIKKTDYEFLVINDGSTDNSLDIIKQETNNYLTHPINMGKGFSIKKAVEYLKNKKYNWFIICDADGQTPIHDIINVWKLYNIYPEAKIFIGNRLFNPKEMPPLRLKVNKIMSWIVSKLAGQKIYDSQCGLKIIHKDVFALKLKSNKFDFETELLIKAGRKGYKILSRPIDCIYLEDRKSKIHPVKDTFKFIKLLIKLIFY